MKLSKNKYIANKRAYLSITGGRPLNDTLLNELLSNDTDYTNMWPNDPEIDVKENADDIKENTNDIAAYSLLYNLMTEVTMLHSTFMNKFNCCIHNYDEYCNDASKYNVHEYTCGLKNMLIDGYKDLVKSDEFIALSQIKLVPPKKTLDNAWENMRTSLLTFDTYCNKLMQNYTQYDPYTYALNFGKKNKVVVNSSSSFLNNEFIIPPSSVQMDCTGVPIENKNKCNICQMTMNTANCYEVVLFMQYAQRFDILIKAMVDVCEKFKLNNMLYDNIELILMKLRKKYKHFMCQNNQKSRIIELHNNCIKENNQWFSKKKSCTLLDSNTDSHEMQCAYYKCIAT